MELRDLTRLMTEFVHSKGWDQENSPRPQTPRNLAISMSLEAAEVLEHFQWNESCKEQDKLASELADVQLYLLQLADVSGIDLEKAVHDKLKINQNRIWDQSTDKEGKR